MSVTRLLNTSRYSRFSRFARGDRSVIRLTAMISTRRSFSPAIQEMSSTLLWPMSRAFSFLQNRRAESSFVLWPFAPERCRVEKASASVRIRCSLPISSVQPNSTCGYSAASSSAWAGVTGVLYISTFCRLGYCARRYLISV